MTFVINCPERYSWLYCLSGYTYLKQGWVKYTVILVCFKILFENTI